MPDQRNIKLSVAYDGTDYSGFQRQANTEQTIQEKLESAILRLTGEATAIYGAGRTDAGVHAQGQVVNFRTRSTIPVERWPLALRSHLPGDIIVYQSEEVAPEFHARYSAVAKTYSYRIWRETWPSVNHRRFTLHYPALLDERTIYDTIGVIKGTHDFRAFSGTGTPVKNTVRTISRLELITLKDEWIIKVRADGFLYHMVRNIVGTLLWVGQGRLTPQSVADAFVSGDRGALGPTALPMGLCLENVEY
jgi:tRNA pseudouridine38-40 synthase